MSTLRLLLCWAFVSSCVLPVLPQTSSNFVCDQFTLDPSVGPENPLIIPERGSQTITCQHSSIGPQGVDWYRDTSVIRDGVTDGGVGCSCSVAPHDFSSGSLTRELTFTDFAPESVGPYSCRVPVPFMPGVFNICQFEVQLAESPTVDNLPPSKSYTVNIGSTLTIPANVSGRPFPDITWRNGSTPLSNNSRVTINGATGALTVTGLTASDRGNYSLTLTNSAGTNTTYISVFVRFVDIVDITDPVSLSNNKIAVTCRGRGYPSVVVEWIDRDRSTILVGTEVVSTESTFERTSSNTLTIDRAQCQDPYTCVVRTESGSPSTARPINICSEPASLPRPMNVMAVQNGRDSVRVSWTIRDAGLINSYTIIYNDGTGEQSVEDLPSTVLSTTITGLEQGMQYTFRVVSVRGAVRNESSPVTETLEDCSQGISNKVFGVTIGTAVNTNGQRTFNISWMEPQEDIVRGYKVMSDQGWEDIVNPKIVTNLLTPANFCNGQDHKFVVMATNNCGVFGPPSATVVGNCDTLSKIKISSVKAYSTAITVKWNLKSGTLIQPPLTITVLEIQLNSNGQQLRSNYSILDIIDEAECLGGLKNSTDYRVCLHPIYTNGMMEEEPVCADFTTGTMETEASVVSSCTKPESMTLVGSTVNQIPIPDFAIALIVVGALIIVSLVFCFIGICLACNNSRSKNIDDLGSEYSSSIGGGMQGRMSNNHNRNMSPTRSCLSYHSKGHSTNWNDHMGTLREMETEVGTNV